MVAVKSILTGSDKAQELPDFGIAKSDLLYLGKALTALILQLLNLRKALSDLIVRLLYLEKALIGLIQQLLYLQKL